MKCYIQNGNNKIVYDVKDECQAAKELILDLLDDEDNKQIHILTIVSQAGFFDDLLKFDMEKVADSALIFLTTDIIACIREDIEDLFVRNELADLIIDMEKMMRNDGLPEEYRKLICEYRD